MHSFSKHLVSIHYGAGIVLDIGVMSVSKENHSYFCGAYIPGGGEFI